MHDQFGSALLVPLFQVLKVLCFALHAQFTHDLDFLFLLRWRPAHLFGLYFWILSMIFIIDLVENYTESLDIYADKGINMNASQNYI